MTVLTVNVGSHSLSVVAMRGEKAVDRLEVDDPPGTDQTARAVRDFVAGLPVPLAVGHRLVHGGDVVTRPTAVDDRIRRELDDVADLAPLHLPPSLTILDQLREALPDLPHVLCPDTAFHADLPESTATLALPAGWRRRWGLRRYGFHGLSYAYAARRAAQLLDRPAQDLHLVLAHLGGGASVCAVREARSVDTSMSFTPLDGLPMGSRSGAVDPGLLLWLLDGRLSRDEILDGLYHDSGLLGLSDGRSNDTRELVPASLNDRASRLALAVFAQRVSREIAAAATSLDRLDAVVFTGEIGWDQPEIRRDVCAGLGLLGVDPPASAHRRDDGPISAEGARVPILIVEPREEIQIARDTLTALRAPAQQRPLGQEL
jgi:acetate kinase